MNKMINVTKSYLPPIEEYKKFLDQIWDSRWLTNHGSLSLELEKKLKDYLGVEHLFLVSNGTIALQIALKALNIKDEVITTPFSYVATTSSICWENCIPVFADIDPVTLNISPEKIEEAITDKTTAIVATHVYGNACDIDKIEAIAKKHGLKVIYDAAHTFGVQYKNRHLSEFGDISTLSFHATKLFHTVEGGAIVCNDDEIAHKISYMRNFGHNGPEEFWGVGINGKNSEFHAAMGLAVLPKIQDLILKRKKLSNLYDKLLKDLNIIKPSLVNNIKYNFAYYPIIFPSEQILIKIEKALNKENIIPRRYFYPALNKLNYLPSSYCPEAESISKRILCLPLYYDLTSDDIKSIAGIIKATIKEQKELVCD